MIDKVNDLVFNAFFTTAHAQVGGLSGLSKNTWFGFFNPFTLAPKNSDSQTTFTNILAYVMGWVLAIIALIAFIYLIIAGVNYITAGGDADKATKARTGIINAIIGVVVVVVAYFILRFAANLGQNVGNAG